LIKTVSEIGRFITGFFNFVVQNMVQNMIAAFTRVSGNAKTGPIPISMTEQKSCPDVCPFKAGKMCYPYFSPLGFMWEALDTGGFYPGSNRRSSTPISWEELCRQVSKLPRGQIWRHNTAGDLPGVGNVIDTQKLDALVQANKGRNGFTYTHKPVGYRGQALVNARAIYATNRQGFRINLSADSLKEADELFDLKIAPVVVVIPSDAPRKLYTPKGRLVIGCPAEQKDEDGNPRIQCDRCQLCSKERNAIIGFHSHGKSVKKVNVMLKVIQ
jgi:hypothetical protein